MDVGEARDLFAAEAHVVESLLGSLARRYGLSADEADSFASFARFRIVKDDYAVIRKFSGRSSLKTYLTVVIANLYRDYRIKRQGKWRPSAAARRLGDAAVLLDAYLNRDGHGLEEAVRRVADRSDVDEDEDELRRWATELPRRPRRSFTDVQELQLAGRARTDAAVMDAEEDAERRRCGEALEAALAELPEQDQVILRLRFWEGLTVANIARTLGVEQKPLYRRIETDLKRLRAELERRGVRGKDVAELITA